MLLYNTQIILYRLNTRPKFKYINTLARNLTIITTFLKAREGLIKSVTAIHRTI